MALDGASAHHETTTLPQGGQGSNRCCVVSLNGRYFAWVYPGEEKPEPVYRTVPAERRAETGAVRWRIMDDPAKSAILDRNLSQRLHRALTVGKEELFQVLEDPSPEVLGAAVRNPVLDVNHLLAVLKRRDLPEEFLKSVFRLELFAESHTLKVAMAHNPATPGSLLSAILPRLYLFELVAICYLPGVTPDQKAAAERGVIQRLPSTPLGNKLVLARRGTSAMAEALVREGDPRFLEACLGNPHLKESAIYAFVNGPTATAETVSMVARHPRWKHRVSLQTAILKNPKTPAVWFTLFLPRLSLLDLKNLRASQRLTSSQKKQVEEELKRRGIG